MDFIEMLDQSNVAARAARETISVLRFAIWAKHEVYRFRYLLA